MKHRLVYTVITAMILTGAVSCSPESARTGSIIADDDAVPTSFIQETPTTRPTSAPSRTPDPTPNPLWGAILAYAERPCRLIQPEEMRWLLAATPEGNVTEEGRTDQKTGQ